MLFGDRVVCSTGDLVAAARCEFALLRALDAELGLVTPVEFPSPGTLACTPDPAVEHRLADLRDRYGPGVTRIRLPGPAADALATTMLVSEDLRERALTALREAHTQTLTALRADADAVAGGVVFDGDFVAHCELLVRDHAPRDTTTWWPGWPAGAAESRP